MVEVIEVKIEKEKNTEIIFGQGTFNLLAVEQLYTALAITVPSSKFGIAFNEGSDNALVRVVGNSPELEHVAHENVVNIGCGHTFFIVIEGSYPIQVLNQIKALQTVVNIFGATGNQASVVVADNGFGRGVLGFVDGVKPTRKESSEEANNRRNFLKKIGYQN